MKLSGWGRTRHLPAEYVVPDDGAHVDRAVVKADGAVALFENFFIKTVAHHAQAGLGRIAVKKFKIEVRAE